MSEATNGAAATLPRATELKLSNGLRVWVYPISQRDRLNLLKEFTEASPPLDKKDYERAVDPDIASFEGQTLSAESNPEYQEMLKRRQVELNDYIARAYLLGYTEFPDHTDDELIQLHARPIARKRKVMSLPDDPWEATLFYALLEVREDYQLIVKAVENNLEVDEGEVIDQMRIFHYRN